MLRMSRSFDGIQQIYESLRVFRDLCKYCIACSDNSIARLMRSAQLKSDRGYHRPQYNVELTSMTSPNRLQQQFNIDQPNAT